MAELSQWGILPPVSVFARSAKATTLGYHPDRSDALVSLQRHRCGTRADGSTRLSSRLSAAGAVMTAGAAYGSLSQGAFYDDQFVVLLALSLAALLLELGRRIRAHPQTLIVPFAFGLVALIGIGFPSVLTGSLHAAMPTFGVIIVVVVGLTLGSGDRAVSEQVLNGLTGCALLSAATAWVGVALHHGPWGLEIEGLWRGASAITYTNAAAALIAMVLVLAVARLCATPGRAMRLLCYCLAVGLLVTMSRAGIAAVGIGLLVVGFCAGWGRLGSALLSIAPSIVIAVAGLVPGLLAGSNPRPAFAFVALAGGAGLAVQNRSGRASISLLMVLAIVGGTMSTFGIFGSAMDQLRETRLVVSSPDRQNEWEAALGQFLESPVTGRGPDQVEFIWHASDDRWLFSEYAHNEYLEMLATHGLVGFVGMGLACLIVLLGIRYRGTYPMNAMTSDGHRIGAWGALAAFTAHSAFDFLWHIPVLPLAAALLAGFLLTPDLTTTS